MPPRKSAQQAAPEPEETEDELDLTAYATKPITPTAEAYTVWIEEQTGYKDIDERSVYLAMSLRRKFQHDPETRTMIAEIREERKPAPAEPEAEKAPAPKRGAAKGVTSSSTVGGKAPARSRSTAAAGGATKAPARGRSRSKAPAAAGAGAAEAPF